MRYSEKKKRPQLNFMNRRTNNNNNNISRLKCVGTEWECYTHTHKQNLYIHITVIWEKDFVHSQQQPSFIKIKWFVLFLHNSFSSVFKSRTRTIYTTNSLLSYTLFNILMNHMHINFILCFPTDHYVETKRAFTHFHSVWWMILIDCAIVIWENKIWNSNFNDLQLPKDIQRNQNAE